MPVVATAPTVAHSPALLCSTQGKGKHTTLPQHPGLSPLYSATRSFTKSETRQGGFQYSCSRNISGSRSLNSGDIVHRVCGQFVFAKTELNSLQVSIDEGGAL